MREKEFTKGEMDTLLGAVSNFSPVILEIWAAILTSKPFFVLIPCYQCG